MTNSYEPCTRIDQFCGAFTIVGHNFAIDYSAHVFFCICSYDQTYAVDSILYSPRCKVNSSPIGVGVTIDEVAYDNVQNHVHVCHRKCRTVSSGQEPQTIAFVFANAWTIGLVRSSPFDHFVELPASAL